jgi:hypothetical protein
MKAVGLGRGRIAHYEHGLRRIEVQRLEDGAEILSMAQPACSEED